MRVAAVYHPPESPDYFVILTCACTYPVVDSMLFEIDIPCPLHEEHRYFGTPRPTVLDDDVWEDDPN